MVEHLAGGGVPADEMKVAQQLEQTRQFRPVRREVQPHAAHHLISASRRRRLGHDLARLKIMQLEATIPRRRHRQVGTAGTDGHRGSLGPLAEREVANLLARLDIPDLKFPVKHLAEDHLVGPGELDEIDERVGRVEGLRDPAVFGLPDLDALLEGQLPRQIRPVAAERDGPIVHPERSLELTHLLPGSKVPDLPDVIGKDILADDDELAWDRRIGYLAPAALVAWKRDGKALGAGWIKRPGERINPRRPSRGVEAVGGSRTGRDDGRQGTNEHQKNGEGSTSGEA